MRKSFLVMALVLLLVTLAGSMVLAKDLSEIKIAWIGKTLNNPWWIQVHDMAIRDAEELGVQISRPCLRRKST